MIIGAINKQQDL